ncbi:transporter, major facilitator family protein [Aeromicrobium marinum DSM 15272]|uniref:Transporter, major facilitator family protein n=1 Tax=Aeromicrobium marinum DSM 15272 TaxID=585531 RepID=E2SFU4_9ACTN|nr:MFS transporter [Aeromicrobium marinum]EFQ81891.1 transporter, major facilitator family protein [Aeromicrobium marinum DSM 15272]
MSPTFRSLAVRNYRVYAVGSLVSNVGTWMMLTAQAWLVLELTGSGTALGITLALQLLPTLLLSPMGGVLADQVDKRTVLRVMQVAMAVPAGVLGVLAVTGVVELWHVYTLAFVFGIGRALEAPARQSFVPEMVDDVDLSNAVALNSASFNAGRLLGPGVAGLLIAALGSGVTGTGWVICLNALSYGAAYAALQMLDPVRLHPAAVVGPRRGAVLEGVRYVRSRPDLVLVLWCVFFLGGFGMNFQITSALMATEVFGLGAQEYGVLGSVLAVGSLAGALLAARRAVPRLRFVLGAGLAFAVVQVASGLMPTYLTYAAVLPLVGLTVITMASTANALIQMTSAPAMRGRVAALYLMVFIGSVPASAPLVGLAAEQLGPRVALVATGLLAGTGIAVATGWFLHRTGQGPRALTEEWHARRRHGAAVPADLEVV